MKKLCSLSTLVIGGVLSLAGMSFAEETGWKPGTRHQIAENLTFAGSVRLRSEFKYDFKFGDSEKGNNDEYLLHQVRLNFKYVTEPISFFVEGQIAGIGEDEAVHSKGIPNIFRDDIDLHQAYTEAALIEGDDQLKLRIGRQKLLFGEQRLVGPLEWVNTARVFDAVAFMYGPCANGDCITAFSSRAVGVDPRSFNDWEATGNRLADSDLHGIYGKFTDIGAHSSLDAFYFLRRESDVDDRVHTVGTRFYGKDAAWDWDGDFAYQFGDFGGLDQNAYAAHVGAGYTIESCGNARFGLAYNYATGDSDPTDGDHETFDNLYPTNHLYYGYMDLFSWQNMHNLEVTAQHSLLDKGQLRIAYHAFWLDEAEGDAWYNAGGGVVRSGAADASNYVGSEIDVTFKYPWLNGRLWSEVGYSHFFAGDFVEDTGTSEDADFVYVQAKFDI